MPKKRYINTREQSFFGNYLYDQVVPERHFLCLLNQMVDWERFTGRLIELYRGGGEYGRPPFNPAQILKMSLLAYFYNISDRQVEVHVNENLSAKYFVGLGIDQRAPDHSTLTRFRNRLTKQGNLAIFEELLAEIVQIAICFANQSRYRIELYIDTNNKETNKIIFDELHAQKETIEEIIGEPLGWERLEDKRASRIALYTLGNIDDDKEKLDQLQDWTAKMLPVFYKATVPEVKKALKKHRAKF